MQGKFSGEPAWARPSTKRQAVRIGLVASISNGASVGQAWITETGAASFGGGEGGFSAG
jgi:hypothetical protein